MSSPESALEAPRWTALRFAAALIPCGVIGSGALHFIFRMDPIASVSEVPLCVIRYLTDISCPGCGMTRAMISLGKLDFQAAYLYHPLSFPLFALALLYTVQGRLPAQRYHRLGAGLGVLVVLGVWAGRCH